MTTTGTQSGQALTRLLRAPWTSGPWLATAQVLVGLPIATLASIVVLTLLGFALSFAVTAILAAPFFAALFASCRLFTGWQRSRIEGMRGAVLPPPVSDPRVGRTFLRRLWADTRSAGAWRQVAYHCLSGLLSPAAAVAVVGAWTLGALLTTVAVYAWALPAHALLGLSPHRPVTVVLLTALGLVLLFAAPWIAELAAALDLAAVRGLLSRSREDELTVRVDTLARDREGVIDAADAQRRRLERDLHDGTQQRLVSLAMNLGMTRTTMTEVPEGVRQAIEQAHEEAKLALSELRDVVRGLHPAVLDDLGLDAAHPLGYLGHGGPGHAEVHRQRHQPLLGTVVQVPLQPAALGVGRVDHALPVAGQRVHPDRQLILAAAGQQPPDGRQVQRGGQLRDPRRGEQQHQPERGQQHDGDRPVRGQAEQGVRGQRPGVDGDRGQQRSQRPGADDRDRGGRAQQSRQAVVRNLPPGTRGTGVGPQAAQEGAADPGIADRRRQHRTPHALDPGTLPPGEQPARGEQRGEERRREDRGDREGQREPEQGEHHDRGERRDRQPDQHLRGGQPRSARPGRPQQPRQRLAGLCPRGRHAVDSRQSRPERTMAHGAVWRCTQHHHPRGSWYRKPIGGRPILGRMRREGWQG